MSQKHGSWLDRLLGRRRPPAPSESGWSFGSRSQPAVQKPRAVATQRAEGPGRGPAVDGRYQGHRERGLQELAAGQAEGAIRELGRAVALGPHLAEAHVNLGKAFQRAGKIEAARAAYQRAMQLEPSQAEARAGLSALPPPPPTREDFRVGQSVLGWTASAYRVLEVKKGGFGVVYIAEREGYSTRYALKTFQAKYLWSEEDTQRFTREAVTWVMLDHHPNIVSAHWVEEIEGFTCLVLEYVAGGDLGQMLRPGPLPQERAIELALQFCDGMSYAHQKLGIVHRDVKPTNCLLDGNGVLKVTDFGLARAFGEAQEAGLGLAGVGLEASSQYTTPAGTTSYMAPEQFRAGAKLDTRTDIYAFGIMLYQMVTGELPVSGSIAQAHIRGSAGRYRINERLLTLIQQCVEPEAGRRPQGFGEVREGLAGAYRALTGRAAPAAAQPGAMGSGEWNNKGLALSSLGRHEEAIECCERGLEIAPQDTNLWTNKGLALWRLGRHEEAIQCYDRGLGIAPCDSALRKNKGVALWSLGRHEESLACYELALEVAPRDSALWQCKGAALEALGRTEEAIQCYEQGLKITPRGSALWKNKGLALNGLGRHQEAIACYDRGLEIAPRDCDLWWSKGVALWGLGRHQEASACYDRGLEIAPRNSVLWKNKAISLRALGRMAEAEECERRARELGG